MKNYIIMFLVSIAILSPFIIPNLLKTPGLTELSFIDICKYTIIITLIITMIYVMIKKLFPSRDKYLLFYSWNDKDKAEAITTQLEKNQIMVLPVTIDYFSKEKDIKKGNQDEYLKNISGVIIILGYHTEEATYLQSINKKIKGFGNNIIYLKTSEDVVIPSGVPKSKVCGVVDQLNDSQFIQKIKILLRK